MKVIVLADLHLGHARVLAEKIRMDLKQVHERLHEVDLLIIAGDVWDKLLLIDNRQTQEALSAIIELLQVARENNVTVRIIRGTWTHDRNQLVVLETINDTSKDLQADLRCISQVSIEYLDDLDLRLLYLPDTDNLPYRDSDELMRVVHELLDSAGWDYVDLVIGHGYFDHVFPPMAKTANTFLLRSNQFKGWVRGSVLMGHVHTHSTKENVTYVGSFDRLNHGEEESKGFLELERIDGKWTKTFIVNKDATKFVTIYPTAAETTVDALLENVYEQLDHKFGSVVNGHLRIALDDPDLRQMIIHCLQQKFGSDLVVTGITTKKDSKPKLQIKTGYELGAGMTELRVSEENLPEHAFLHLQEMHGTSPLSIEKLRELLGE